MSISRNKKALSILGKELTIEEYVRFPAVTTPEIDSVKGIRNTRVRKQSRSS